MFTETSPNPVSPIQGDDRPERAPESGDPLDRTPVARDPDIGCECGDREELAPESGDRAILTPDTTPSKGWHSIEVGFAPTSEPPARARGDYPAGRSEARPAIPRGVLLAVGVLAAGLGLAALGRVRHRYSSFKDWPRPERPDDVAGQSPPVQAGS
jgi:hypothetical protein